MKAVLLNWGAILKFFGGTKENHNKLQSGHSVSHNWGSNLTPVECKSRVSVWFEYIQNDICNDIFTGRKKRRIQIQQQSLLKVVPNTEEQKVIHNTFLQTVDVRDPTIHKRVLPPNSMWMDDVSYSSIIFGQPEVISQE